MKNKVGESCLKLKWNIQGIFDDIPAIGEQLESQISQIPENNINSKIKITKWLNQIKEINETIRYLKEHKLVELEQNLNYKFDEPDLFVLSFIQPSIKNLFAEVNKYYSKAGIDYNFEPYLSLDEAAKVLAFIGDAAIDLALAEVLWQPNISNVGDLSVNRSKIASNGNLARICDKWDMFDHRIPFESKPSGTKIETINHVKGTMVEAVFGIIYIESGLDDIITSIVSLK
ncbi:MAG: hypothetical protein K8R11_02410 [Methanococcoides sp.]|nr:hypothetical protein [Methanococcoides sp.]